MKIYQKIKKKIRVWAVSWVFKIYFRTYVYPFDRADDKFEKLSPSEKAAHLSAISNWVNSSAYKLESTEFLRKLYEDLATKPADDIMITAHRLCLLAEQDKQKRLARKAAEFERLNYLD